MEKIAVLTDSTCGLTLDHLNKNGIIMVPLSVFFGEEEYQDEVEMNADAFYQKLGLSFDHPTTSQPSVGKFLETFQSLKREGFTNVICIHISKKLSGTAQSAQAAAGMIKELEINVIDSTTICTGLGYLVDYAKQMVDEGKTAEQIVTTINMKKNDIQIMFSVDSLDALQKGGRIGKAQALIGKYLGIKPVLTVKDGSGEIEVMEKVFSGDAARKAIIGEVIKKLDTTVYRHRITVVYGGLRVYADRLMQALEKTFIDKPLEIKVGRIGAVIGTHLGPDGWGVIID